MAMFFIIVAVMQLTKLHASEEDNSVEYVVESEGVMDYPMPVSQPSTCSRSCMAVASRQCVDTAQNQCQQKCSKNTGGWGLHVPGRPDSGGYISRRCYNQWGSVTLKTYEIWINQIRNMNLLTLSQINEIYDCNETTPYDLYQLLSIIMEKKRSQITNNVRLTILAILRDVDQCCRPPGGWVLNGGRCSNEWGSISQETYRSWINELRNLNLLTLSQINQIWDCTTTTPDELIELIHVILRTNKAQLTMQVQQTILHFIRRFRPGYNLPSIVWRCNNGWGAVSEETYRNWINQLRDLNLLTLSQINEIFDCTKTTPDDLFQLISFMMKRSQISAYARIILATIFRNLDQCCRPPQGWITEWTDDDVYMTGRQCSNGWGAISQDTYTKWINQIRNLNLLSLYQINKISDCSQTTPDDLIESINLIMRSKRPQITRPVQQTFLYIIRNIRPGYIIRNIRPDYKLPNIGWTGGRQPVPSWSDDSSGQQGYQCNMNVNGMSVVPTIIYTQWINNIKDLGFITQKELCECENYARTKPDQLIQILNTIFYKKGNQISRERKQNMKTIIMNIGHFITRGRQRQTDVEGVVNIPIKIISWRQDIDRIANHESVQKSILQRLISIINSAGTASDCFPIIHEITRISSQVPHSVRNELQVILIDMKRAALKEKISYLLTMYDNLLQQDIKDKLAQLCFSEDTYRTGQMQQQYQQIVGYVSSIVKRRTLPKPIISELQMILIRLGIDGFGTGTLLGSGLDGGSQFISIRQLIAKLSSSSSAIFGVTRPDDCNIESFCTDSILESVCTYGAGECRSTATQRGNKLTCKVEIIDCKKTPPVPQLTTEEVLNLLKSQQYAETITYSAGACNALGKQFMDLNAYTYGGSTCKVDFNLNTKKCSLQISGQKGASLWLDGQCGKGCKFNELQFLDLRQVSISAHQGFGVRFKTADDATCKQYCSTDVDIPSSCPGNFECSRGCKCWPESCVCTIKHKCEVGNRMFRSGKSKNRNVYKPDNNNIQETIELPRVMPVINKGMNFINKKPKKKQKKDNEKLEDAEEYEDEDEEEDEETDGEGDRKLDKVGDDVVGKKEDDKEDDKEGGEEDEIGDKEEDKVGDEREDEQEVGEEVEVGDKVEDEVGDDYAEKKRQ